MLTACSTGQGFTVIWQKVYFSVARFNTGYCKKGPFVSRKKTANIASLVITNIMNSGSEFYESNHEIRAITLVYLTFYHFLFYIILYYEGDIFYHNVNRSLHILSQCVF